MTIHKFYVVQIGYAIFGYGDTAQDAVAMANDFIDRGAEKLTVENIPVYSGKSASTGAVSGWQKGTEKQKKAVNNDGSELIIGSMVIVDSADILVNVIDMRCDDMTTAEYMSLKEKAA